MLRSLDARGSLRRLLAVTIAAAAAATLTPSTGHAQLACGGTIGPGGSFTMTSSIPMCGASIALEVVGPVELDMAGHTISCDGGLSTGVHISGKAAVVTRGHVSMCTVAVSVGGDGHHQVRGVHAIKNTLGFGVTSDGNALTSNAAQQNTSGGFQILGNQNKLTGNASLQDGPVGFSISGSRNSFLRNTAAVALRAFHTDAMSASNKFKENTASNAAIGFAVEGARHTLLKNAAVTRDVSDMGFSLDGDGGHSVKENTSTGPIPAAGTGIRILSDGNRVKNNRASFHQTGIAAAAGAHDNTITGNDAVGNFFDGSDNNAGCDDNVWKDNLFLSSAPACVQ